MTELLGDEYSQSRFAESQPVPVVVKSQWDIVNEGP